MIKSIINIINEKKRNTLPSFIASIITMFSCILAFSYFLKNNNIKSPNNIFELIYTLINYPQFLLLTISVGIITFVTLFFIEEG